MRLTAPKPLPLPAPTPFTPGLDSLNPEPAANLAPAGKFIVLKGNRLVEGTAKVQGDKVVVRQGALDRIFAKADVLCIADSRDGVYQFMRREGRRQHRFAAGGREVVHAQRPARTGACRGPRDTQSSARPPRRNRPRPIARVVAAAIPGGWIAAPRRRALS